MNESNSLGRNNAPLLVVMPWAPSENMLSWFWKSISDQCGILKTDIRIVYLLNNPPKGSGAKITKDQLRNSWQRFSEEVTISSPSVVMPMGGLALYYTTGIKENINASRGYVIDKSFFRSFEWEVYEQVGEYKTGNKSRGIKKGDPKYKWVNKSFGPLVGLDYQGVVIPTFDLNYIQGSGFTVTPAFKEDIRRVKRALEGTLKLIDDPFFYYRDFSHIASSESSRIPVGLHLTKVEWSPPVVAVDIETEGFDNQVINRVSISDGIISASIAWDLNAVDLLNKLFERPDLLFAFHNSPFDVPRLQSNGVNITEEVLNKQVFDTMFGAVTLQPDLLKGLGAAATIYLDCQPWKWKSLSTASPIFYSAKDAFITAWLAKQEIKVMQSLGLWNLFMGKGKHPGPGVMATIPELTDMNVKGIRTNREYALWWTPFLERKQLRLEKLWGKSFPGTNPHSTKQLQAIFYKEWGLPIQRSREGKISTDELALVKLKTYVEIAPSGDSNNWKKDSRCTPRIFDLVLKLRDVSKTLSTYVQPVAAGEYSWIHPHYMPVSKDSEDGKSSNKVGNIEVVSKGNTATGRLATYNPNIGNQPSKVRILYVPDTDDFSFVESDWKMAELYVMAYMANDKVLIDDLNAFKINPKNDIHQRNADRFRITRKVSKNVTYARQYLAGPTKISDMILGQEHIYVPIEECKRISTGLGELYWTTEAYKRHIIEIAEAKKYVKNPFGRIRYFHVSNASAAVNFIPQSVVGDMLWCILKPVADMARSLGGRLTTSVYDSILIQVPKNRVSEAARKLKKIMEQVFDLIVPNFYIPCTVKIGEPGASWSDLKEIEI